jgi:hypothetical protein
MNIANKPTPNTLNVPKFPSTASNSKVWKIWHGVNYMFGGLLFVIGSVCYYPDISKVINGDLVGGWLFTIGKLSLTTKALLVSF